MLNESGPLTTANLLSYGYRSDVGLARDTNEDSCAVLKRSQLNDRLDCLLVVADGLGGRRAGEVASSLLVETLTFGVLETTSSLNRALTTREIEQLMRDCIVRANGTIMTQGRFQRREDTRGMATTCVAAILDSGRLTIGHVGDSRIYLQRGEEMRQLTMDHSEVYEELIKGNITEEEARNHRFRNQITRAVGLDPNVRPDITTMPLEPGDTLLLCTDGLTTEVPDHAISDILCTAPTSQAACDKLVKVALRSGGRDNITVVVLRYGDFEPLGDFEYEPEEEPEDTTDPVQDWKRPITPEDLDKPDWKDDIPIPSARAPERKPAMGGSPSAGIMPVSPDSPQAKFLAIAPALVFMLLLGVLVEGALIVNLRTQLQNKLPVAPLNPGANVPKSPGSMVYEAVKQVTDVKLLPDYLQISPKGNPIVAKADGTLVTVLISEHKLVAMGPLYPSMHPREARKGASGDVYVDASGTLYYLNPDTACIETYTANGTRTNQDLGKSQLTAPSRLIADEHGNIYVIDAGRLKVLNVKDSGAKASHPSGADF
jgi:PPM family protein phosphatase